MKPVFKLSICVPSGPTLYTDFAMCLLNMMMALAVTPVLGFGQSSVNMINKRTSLLPKSRQNLLEDCLTAGSDYALFIDTDQTFPANLVHQLAMHKKDVMACNVATKMLPSSPTARNKHPSWPGGDVVYSNRKVGIEQVWRIGTGVMLLNLDVVRKMRKPWFATVWNDELNDFMGEDWYFCERLERQGTQIWVDHNASRMVGHIGTYTYEHSDIQVKTTPELIQEEEARLRLAV